MEEKKRMIFLDDWYLESIETNGTNVAKHSKNAKAMTDHKIAKHNTMVKWVSRINIVLMIFNAIPLFELVHCTNKHFCGGFALSFQFDW